jgi:hypothetical protein
MQLRDIAPGTVVTVPIWGGYEKYVVGPHLPGDVDIALIDESGNPSYGHSCLRVGIVATGSVMSWALYQEKVRQGKTVDPRTTIVMIPLAELLPLVKAAKPCLADAVAKTDQVTNF